MIYGLSVGDILKVDSVLEEGVHKCLKWSAYLIEKNGIEIKKIKGK